MAKVAVNFTGVNDQPEGEMLLEVEKAEVKDSKSGHPLINLQCVIKASEDGRWDGRKIFPMLMLETDMKRVTFQALAAMGFDVPEGNFDLDTDELVGKQVWVFAISKERPDGQGNQTNIRAWGIEPKKAKLSIS